MALPRKAEFDVNVLAQDGRIAGAGFWAYGNLLGSSPAPSWNGWTNFTSNPANTGELVDAEFYYDACRAYYGIADYTQDPQWLTIASRAVMQGYLPWVEQFSNLNNTPPLGAGSGYHIFGWGLYLNSLRDPNASNRDRCKTALMAMANDSAGLGYQTPMNYFGAQYPSPPSIISARDIGYNLVVKHLALLAGYTNTYGGKPWGLTAGDFSPESNTSTLVDLALMCLDQWMQLLAGNGTGTATNTNPDTAGILLGNPIDPNYQYTRPFMVANVIEGLQLYVEATPDARVLPKVLTVLEAMWQVCFRPNGVTLSNTLPLDGNNDGGQVGPGAGGPAPANDVQYGINSMTYTDRNPPIGVDTGDNGFGCARVDPTKWEWWWWDGNPRWDTPHNSGLWPTPELNGLLLPAYYWAFQQTGNTLWRDRADLLFDGMVRVGSLNSRYGTETGVQYDNTEKVFNQMYSRIWPYVMARIRSGALALPGSSYVHAIPGTSGAKALP